MDLSLPPQFAFVRKMGPPPPPSFVKYGSLPPGLAKKVAPDNGT